MKQGKTGATQLHSLLIDGYFDCLLQRIVELINSALFQEHRTCTASLLL
jgi:hypothetical protein